MLLVCVDVISLTPVPWGWLCYLEFVAFLCIYYFNGKLRS